MRPHLYNDQLQHGITQPHVIHKPAAERDRTLAGSLAEGRRLSCLAWLVTNRGGSPIPTNLVDRDQRASTKPSCHTEQGVTPRVSAQLLSALLAPSCVSRLRQYPLLSACCPCQALLLLLCQPPRLLRQSLYLASVTKGRMHRVSVSVRV